MQGAIDRGNEDAFFKLWQGSQGFQALGDNILMRRKTVIGQRFPVRQFLKIRRRVSVFMLIEKFQFGFETLRLLGIFSQQQNWALVVFGTIGDTKGTA